MVVPIKLFQWMQNCLNSAGFIARDANQHGYCTFNQKNLFHLFSLGLMLLSASTFFFVKANTVYEYGASYTGSNIGVIVLLYYSVFMCKTKDVLLLIGRYERFIEKREKIWLAKTVFLYKSTNFLFNFGKINRIGIQFEINKHIHRIECNHWTNREHSRCYIENVVYRSDRTTFTSILWQLFYLRSRRCIILFTISRVVRSLNRLFFAPEKFSILLLKN